MTRAAVIERHRQQRNDRAALKTLTAHHFDAQRDFYKPRKKSLRAALCSRRAGKTRGGNESDVELAAQTQDGRFLYINETRAEARRLAWHGARGDGMMSLCRDRGWIDSGFCKINETELTIHFPSLNSWIFLIGVDDDAAIHRALGTPWNRVRWDEAQRIKPKFRVPILETMLPALLDYSGEVLFTGTPERQMSGLFYDITRADSKERGWSVSRWTLTDNPYWGRPKQIDGKWFAVWGAKDEIVSGPHEPGALLAAVMAARHLTGVMGLQELLGGADVAPLDGSLIRRQAYGEWVREDSNFVYAVNKLTDAELFYAPHRRREDGFVDVPGALADLPGDWRDYAFSMGVDLGFVDAFAMVLWAWRGSEPTLYEVFSFSQSGLDSNEQNDRMRAVREHVNVGQIVADSGGVGKQVAVGWSKEWIERYSLPITEAKKQHKQTNIQSMNADIIARHVKFREDGPLIAEMRDLQWSVLVDGSGRMIEDPSMANHCADASLYSHVHSYAYRAQPVEIAPPPGTAAHFARIAAELEDENDEQFEQPWRRRGRA